jgi:hypothetical protein
MMILKTHFCVDCDFYVKDLQVVKGGKLIAQLYGVCVHPETFCIIDKKPTNCVFVREKFRGINKRRCRLYQRREQPSEAANEVG